MRWRKEIKHTPLKSKIIANYHSVNKVIAFEGYIYSFSRVPGLFTLLTERTYHSMTVAITDFGFLMRSEIHSEIEF